MLAHLKDNEFVVTQMRNFSPGEHERIIWFLTDNNIEFTSVEYIDTGYEGPERYHQCRFDIMVSYDPSDCLSVYVGDYIIIEHQYADEGQEPNFAVLGRELFNKHFGIHETGG